MKDKWGMSSKVRPVTTEKEGWMVQWVQWVQEGGQAKMVQEGHQAKMVQEGHQAKMVQEGR